MISYYWTHRQNPIAKFKLKKKLGNEWQKVEQKAKTLKMIYGYHAIIYTNQGTVIAENNTLVLLSQLVSALIAIAAFIATLCRGMLPSPLKYVCLGLGIACLLASAVIMFLGFKNDERHIVDMGAPLLWGGLISLGASFFW